MSGKSRLEMLIKNNLLNIISSQSSGATRILN